MFFKRKNEENILKKIYERGRLKRYTQFILGMIITALSYNLFMIPSSVVYGVGGLGVMFKQIFNWSPSVVILIGSILLLILSFLLLGIEKTKNSIIGSLLYPVFVSLTEWIPRYVNLSDADPIIIVIFGAVIAGFGLGLIFKSGFTTGGTDILNQIVSKYFKMSLGTSMFFTDGLIIASSVFVFGWTKLMYSLISLYIISIMTDKVILGISQSKAFYIITEHETEVKRYITNTLKHGITVLDGRGGYTGNNQKIIMCIIPTKEYFMVKEGIYQIDKEAFFIVTDAYEVSGGI
ncbi:MAG: YitT family protein [Bacilli bacterium]|nr:YitT family protein [Bacilli bacterium]